MQQVVSGRETSYAIIPKSLIFGNFRVHSKPTTSDFQKLILVVQSQRRKEEFQEITWVAC
jgi:hypothetical protein